MNANAIIRASAPFFQKYVLSPEMPAKRHLAMMLLGLCFTAPLLANEVLRIESQAQSTLPKFIFKKKKKALYLKKRKRTIKKERNWA